MLGKIPAPSTRRALAPFSNIALTAHSKSSGPGTSRRDKLQVQRSSPHSTSFNPTVRSSIPEDAHALGVRDGRDEKFQPFGVNIEILQAQPVRFSAWAREREDRPNRRESAARVKTIGIVWVAVLAACAAVCRPQG